MTERLEVPFVHVRSPDWPRTVFELHSDHKAPVRSGEQRLESEGAAVRLRGCGVSSRANANLELNLCEQQ